MTEEEKYSKVRAVFNISSLKSRRKHQTWDQEAGLEYEVIKVIKKHAHRTELLLTESFPE